MYSIQSSIHSIYTVYTVYYTISFIGHNIQYTTPTSPDGGGEEDDGEG